jgi:RimJ/RimL family protein N-acetyltransferase
MIDGDGFRLRPAAEDDLAYLVELASRPEVADFLAGVSPWAEDEVRAAIEAAREDPVAQARLVLEVADAGAWRRSGALAFAVANRRSRIAYLFGVMIDPACRGRGLGERATRSLALHLVRQLGYHRVQLEVYGFNERALRLFERAGFVREGVRRKAYWRHGSWQDGITFGLVAEDLDELG